MRTTISLDPDVAAAVEQLRREGAGGVSAIVNSLIRRGLTDSPQRRPFVQRTAPMGARIDVANIADVLETIEGPAAR